jgi:uncharacterized protein (DUF58 family)
MPLWILNILGWIKLNPLKAALYLFAFLGLVYVVTWFACGRSKVNVSQEQIDKINTANKQERQAELRAVVEENAEVVTAVNQNTTIAETHVAERNEAIDAKVKEADKKIEEVKKQGKDVTQEELQCLLMPTDCQ